MHAGRFRKVLLEGVDDRPVSLAHIKGDEVSRTLVPWATACGNGRMCVIPGWWEVSSAGPLSGCLGFSLSLVVASRRWTGRVGVI